LMFSDWSVDTDHGANQLFYSHSVVGVLTGRLSFF
jgi:hypothetical protein